MGKQSTLGKFWGKAGAGDQAKVDEENKTDDNAAAVQEAKSNGSTKAAELENKVAVASAVDPKPSSETKRKYSRLYFSGSSAQDHAFLEQLPPKLNPSQLKQKAPRRSVEWWNQKMKGSRMNGMMTW
jgi:hypothetical protein